MRRIKSYLLILLALWLPLQAAAAVAMPFCRHAAVQVLPVSQAEATQAPTHCQEHAGAIAAPTDTEQAVDCDNCEMCHLATAGYLPVTATGVTPQSASIFVALPAAAPPSHIGEPPQQPPRRLN